MFGDEATAGTKDGALFNENRSEDDNSSVQDFKKAKEGMKRLGFDSWEEYQDYLDFMKMRKNRGVGLMM